jgi:hypothetical protein
MAKPGGKVAVRSKRSGFYSSRRDTKPLGDLGMG